MRTCRALSASFALVAAACGGVTPAPRATPPKAVARSETPKDDALDAQAVLRAVVQVRGLQPKSPIAIDVVDDEAFAVSFRAEVERRRAARGTARSVHSSGDPGFYLAYYDTGKRTVLLRRKTPDWAKRMDPRELLAHEIEHALQDQYWPIDDLLNATETDVQRGHLALLEGDAQVAAAGASAVLNGLPPKRAIVRGTLTNDTVTSDMFVAGGLVDPRTVNLKPAEREELIFPYRYGASFVGALFRAGGFDLVNRAFSRPPGSSAEILHPEAYLAGRVPQPVILTADPPGYATEGTRGPVGEFTLRNVLASWGIGASQTRNLAAAWRGDAFAMARGPDGKAASRWTLIFADDADAMALLSIFAAHGRVRQSGHILAYVEGFPEPLASELVLHGPDGAPKVAHAPSAPFGNITIPPPPPRIEDTLNLHGELDALGTFRCDALGLAAAPPRGMTVKPPSDPKGPLLGLFTSGRAALILSLDSMRPTPTLVYAMKGGLSMGIKGQGEPSTSEDASTPTPLGVASERRLHYPTGLNVRFLPIPICEKEASLTVTFSWRDGDEAEVAAAEAWLAALDPTPISASPFCKAVRLERTTDLP